MPDADRARKIGEAVEQLADQRNRLAQLERQATGLAKSLRDVAGRLESTAKGASGAANVSTPLACPDADKVIDVYDSIGDARMRIVALGEQLDPTSTRS